MPDKTSASDKKRLDPNDPRPGARRNDERKGERSSPGSGEDEDVKNGPADLQPDDVEGGDTAR